MMRSASAPLNFVFHVFFVLEFSGRKYTRASGVMVLIRRYGKSQGMGSESRQRSHRNEAHHGNVIYFLMVGAGYTTWQRQDDKLEASGHITRALGTDGFLAHRGFVVLI